MALRKYKSLLLAVTAVSALLLVSPVLQQFLVVPQTDFFTELSLYGQYHNATYPYNVTAAQTYQLYLDVANHLDQDAKYIVEVKFGNETQSAPDSFNHTASTLPSLGNYSFSVSNNQTFELPITFSLQYILNSKVNQLNLQNITLSGRTETLSGAFAWDTQNRGFYGNLYFELWIFNDTTGSYQYNQRFVSLWLNLNT